MAEEKNLPQNDEVDLGNLFKIIGKGFKNLFDAIALFFKGLFNLLILLLIFLRNNALKIGISMIIGGAIGFVLDISLPRVYYSNMIVEPNFKSTQQLYSNIRFYNELVKQKESDRLAELLKISQDEAKDLKSFYVEPIKNENEKYDFFDRFIAEVDTTTSKKIDIKEFAKAFTDYDYRYHQIRVESKNNTIFEKLSNPIVNSIESNTYFKNQKKINDENLVQNERVLKQSLAEVDTLRKIYNEVLILDAKKSEAGTTITMAEGTKKTGEIELFDESLSLNRELIENNKEKAETTEIINVVSNFNPVGTKKRGVFNKYTSSFGIGFGVLMLVFILLKRLNTYLGKYN